MPKRKRLFSSVTSTFTNYVSPELSTNTAADAFPLPQARYYDHVVQYQTVDITLLADVPGYLSLYGKFTGEDSEVPVIIETHGIVANVPFTLRRSLRYPYYSIGWARGGPTPTGALSIYTIFQKAPLNVGDLTVESLGTGESDVINGVGPNITFKRFKAGTGIDISTVSSDIVITNTSTGSDVTLIDDGGVTGDTLITDGVGPQLKLKGIKSANSDVQVSTVGSDIVLDIGSGASGTGSVKITNGTGDNTNSNYTVALGHQAGETAQGIRSVAIGYQAGQNNQLGDAVAIGPLSGDTSQGTRSVAIGYSAGSSNQLGNSVAIGTQAGQINQSANAVAIGNSTGSNTQGDRAIAIGLQTGSTSQGYSSTAIGYLAGNDTQASYSVAIGHQAGRYLQQGNSIAIGYFAGQGQVGTGQGATSIAIGYCAGQITQGTHNVAIGTFAAQTGQIASAVAIGHEAAYYDQLTGGIAIGYQAARGAVSDPTKQQKAYGIAIGYQAANTGQAQDSIALGRGCVGPTVNGRLAFGPNMEAIQTTATAGTRTLPANPAGFIRLEWGGTLYKIPVYND